MKTGTTIAAAALALAAVYVFGDWVYEGQWGSLGAGTYLLNLSNLKGVCAFRVPNTTPSVKITATKHNYVPVVRTAFKP